MNNMMRCETAVSATALGTGATVTATETAQVRR